MISDGTAHTSAARRAATSFSMDSAMGATAVALAVLSFGHVSHPGPIYILAAIGSSAGAFDGPARQSLTPSLVPREHLPNAISLNSIMLQIASVSGPAIGGSDE